MTCGNVAPKDATKWRKKVGKTTGEGVDWRNLDCLVAGNTVLCKHRQTGVTYGIAWAKRYDGGRRKLETSEGKKVKRKLGKCWWTANKETLWKFRSWLNMACKQAPTNENYGAFPSGACIHLRYYFGGHSCTMTVHRMHDADGDKDFWNVWMAGHIFLQYGDLCWHKPLWLIWHQHWFILNDSKNKWHFLKWVLDF